jgi:Ser/Thr protein kinase RdoA (MazF antagonist)
LTESHLHEHTRGVLTADDLRFSPPNISEELLRPFLRKHWGIEGELSRLSGERDQNFRITAADGSRYVFKIASPLEDLTLVDFQIQALLYLEASDPGIPIPRIRRSLKGNLFETLTTDQGDHAVRVLSWVDGVRLGDFEPPSHDTIAQIGALQGRLCRAFRGFEHEGSSHFMPWDILNGLVVSESLRNDYLRGDLAERCAPVLEHLSTCALPRMRELPHQIIHNDAHSGNVLCDPTDPATITGVIDFGDLVHRPIVVDLATSLASIMETSETPISASAALVGGFVQYSSVPPEQLELVYDALLARAIMIVQLLQFRAENTVVDASLVEEDIPDVKRGLERALAMNRTEFHDALRDAVSSRSADE